MSADHGPVISDEEYEQRIIELYESRTPIYSEDDAVFIRKAELSIEVDRRLGICFPYDRRDDLWDAQQRIERKKSRLFLFLLLRVFGIDLLSKIVWQEFSAVLDAEEMSDFFGADFYISV